MIGFQAGEDTDQAEKLLAADTCWVPPGLSLVNTPPALLSLVEGERGTAGPGCATRTKRARTRGTG